MLVLFRFANLYFLIHRFFLDPFPLYYPTGQHECEIFGSGLEATESAFRWENCEKNPGHEGFTPYLDFTDNLLLRSMCNEQRRRLKVIADLTVRVRVNWTSLNRFNSDRLAEYRGSDGLRLGTGFVRIVKDPRSNEPCPCNQCDGKIVRKHWTFTVQTAHHVVFNTEEAKRTRIDLFYDDENSPKYGRMHTVQAVDMIWFYPQRDHCGLLCVTHDETLGERLASLHQRWISLIDFPDQPPSNRPWQAWFERLRAPFSDGSSNHAVVVSHPHGQPKKISVGKVIGARDQFYVEDYVEYHTPTCSGSSGAPVFPLHLDSRDSRLRINFLYANFVHSGTNTNVPLSLRTQVNYGNLW